MGRTRAAFQYGHAPYHRGGPVSMALGRSIRGRCFSPGRQNYGTNWLQEYEFAYGNSTAYGDDRASPLKEGRKSSQKSACKSTTPSHASLAAAVVERRESAARSPQAESHTVAAHGTTRVKNLAQQRSTRGRSARIHTARQHWAGRPTTGPAAAAAGKLVLREGERTAVVAAAPLWRTAEREGDRMSRGEKKAPTRTNTSERRTVDSSCHEKEFPFRRFRSSPGPTTRERCSQERCGVRGGGAQSAAAACQTVVDTLSDGVAALPDAERSVGFRGKRGSAVQTPRAKGRAGENQTMGTGAANRDANGKTWRRAYVDGSEISYRERTASTFVHCGSHDRENVLTESLDVNTVLADCLQNTNVSAVSEAPVPRFQAKVSPWNNAQLATA
ncbi:hypothetical protein HPB50_002252 [Hyalomma asiaticum]|uniref:Uncharacterized protein n=1 Tax=Hyalomma asiaticum TaxID=266040 RepID=A0ACB7TB71_HYAAI|nr:hypothetical protein HPB50_002252 [Hyalomma asiaticum]